MKKSLFKLITIIFITILPFLIILTIIPIFIFQAYFKTWKNMEKQKEKNIGKAQSQEVYTKIRIEDVLPIFKKILPMDVKSALDIGSGRDIKRNFLKENFEKYISLDVKNADIIQDLNIKQKIPLKNNSIDIVILSNILEHLVDPIPIVIEANRISKKYLLIGLPNEYPLDKRLFVLLGFHYDKIYPLGHKHSFSLNSIEIFIKSIWDSYISKIYRFHFLGKRFIPRSIRKLLMKSFPSLFIGEVFYLVKKTKINKNQIQPYERT